MQVGVRHGNVRQGCQGGEMPLLLESQPLPSLLSLSLSSLLLLSLFYGGGGGGSGSDFACGCGDFISDGDVVAEAVGHYLAVPFARTTPKHPYLRAVSRPLRWSRQPYRMMDSFKLVSSLCPQTKLNEYMQVAFLNNHPVPKCSERWLAPRKKPSNSRRKS